MKPKTPESPARGCSMLTYNLDGDCGGDGLHQLTVGGGAGDVAGLVPAGDLADDDGAPDEAGGGVDVQPHGGEGHGVLPPDDGWCGVPALGGAVEPHLSPLHHLQSSLAGDLRFAGPSWRRKLSRNFSQH